MPAPLAADVLCRTAVTFEWKRAAVESGENPPATHWGILEQRGADEAAVKSELTERAELEKKKADEACRRTHENLTGCVSAKFGALTATMQNLSFTQRKTIEDAVTVDCRARQGTCHGAKFDEIACTQLAGTGEGTGEADGAADPKAKKDSKKPKKK